MTSLLGFTSWQKLFSLDSPEKLKVNWFSSLVREFPHCLASYGILGRLSNTSLSRGAIPQTLPIMLGEAHLEMQSCDLGPTPLGGILLFVLTLHSVLILGVQLTSHLSFVQPLVDIVKVSLWWTLVVGRSICPVKFRSLSPAWLWIQVINTPCRLWQALLGDTPGNPCQIQLSTFLPSLVDNSIVLLVHIKELYLFWDEFQHIKCPLAGRFDRGTN